MAVIGGGVTTPLLVKPASTGTAGCGNARRSNLVYSLLAFISRRPFLCARIGVVELSEDVSSTTSIYLYFRYQLPHHGVESGFASGQAICDRSRFASRGTVFQVRRPVSGMRIVPCVYYRWIGQSLIRKLWALSAVKPHSAIEGQGTAAAHLPPSCQHDDYDERPTRRRGR